MPHPTVSRWEEQHLAQRAGMSQHQGATGRAPRIRAAFPDRPITETHGKIGRRTRSNQIVQQGYRDLGCSVRGFRFRCCHVKRCHDLAAQLVSPYVTNSKPTTSVDQLSSLKMGDEARRALNADERWSAAGETRYTSYIKPRRSSAQMTYPERSICHQWSPWNAERGKA